MHLELGICQRVAAMAFMIEELLSTRMCLKVIWQVHVDRASLQTLTASVVLQMHFPVAYAQLNMNNFLGARKALLSRPVWPRQLDCK